MIKTIDREACSLIRAELNKILPSVGEKLGLTVSVGSGSFSPDNVTFKVTAAVKGEGGVALTKEALDFKRYAKSIGLDAEDLGKPIRYAGRDYTIVGYKPRSYRFPILAKMENGKTFKLPVEGVRAALGKAVTPAVKLVQTPPPTLTTIGQDPSDNSSVKSVYTVMVENAEIRKIAAEAKIPFAYNCNSPLRAVNLFGERLHRYMAKLGDDGVYESVVTVGNDEKFTVTAYRYDYDVGIVKSVSESKV